jgi:Spy/CpxP family protein refolding chaperone
LAFLLALSLALNLAFLAGLAYKTWRPRRAAPAPGAQIRSDLTLSAAQEGRVRAVIHKFKIDSLMAKGDIRDKRVEIIEELGNPEFDPKKVGRLGDELNALENGLNRDFIAALLEINEILEPEQRLNMLYRLSRDWFFLTPGREKGGPHE